MPKPRGTALWTPRFWRMQERRGTRLCRRSRLNEIVNDAGFVDERKALQQCAALLEQLSNVKGCLKMRDNELNEKVAAKYGKLTEDEIKALVVDDKWLTKLAEDVSSELDRVSHALTDRIAELAKRYETPLPRIAAEVAALAARVDDHLKKMGAVWN